MSTRRIRRPGSVALAKDLVLFAVGLFLILHEAFVRPQDFNPYLLGMGGILAGVPGSLQLLAPRTDGRQSPAALERSRPRSRSSSREPEADR